MKTTSDILRKLGISELNAMQQKAFNAIKSSKEVLLLSPTGSGKTLAFVLPLLEMLDKRKKGVQLLIMVPSRELGIQIEQVFRDIGSGYKVNLVYGGRRIAKDKIELAHLPSILIGTPGRIADHCRRDPSNFRDVSYLVIDEYDKVLEIGFEEDMDEIVSYLPNLSRKIYTSATSGISLPDFLNSHNPKTLHFLDFQKPKIQVKRVVSPDKDKLSTLLNLLCNLGEKAGIVFCNFKDSIERVSNYLGDHGIQHVCFHGGLEQRERERALIKFRNGTERILLATDLAARGLDVPSLHFIIHYHLPFREEEYTHRNGRTARMKEDGTVYVIHWEGDELPEFIRGDEYHFQPSPKPKNSEWRTVFISGGKRDKISKGDIAGLCFKQGKLSKQHLGLIELKSDCAFVAVQKSKVNQLIKLADNTKLKTKKVRIFEV